MRFKVSVLAGLLASILLAQAAAAQYYRKPISDLDPEIMRIDEKKYLGAKLDGGTMLVGEDGRPFPLSDLLGKPLVLVLSYYTCDGSCSVINNELNNLLDDVKRVRPGEDFRILTLSFDTHDDLKTTGAFKRGMDIRGAYADNWAFATFQREADLKAQTAKIGFKFFWSPEDKVFLHPGAFLFLAPDGRLIRILYPPNVEGSDVELAVLDAKQGQFRPQEIINFAVSLCYSYNYAEGKYTLSIPVFVGFGALLSGIIILLTSIFVFKSKKRKTMGDMDHAHVA